MRVTLAYPYQAKDGKSYKQDETVELPDVEAVKLLRNGRGRRPDAAQTVAEQPAPADKTSGSRASQAAPKQEG